MSEGVCLPYKNIRSQKDTIPKNYRNKKGYSC